MKIFFASTGRCGTKFCADVFRTLTSVPTFHEPTPYIIGQNLYEVNNPSHGVSDETKRLLDAKIRFIKSASRDGWYCETSQLFIKAYAERIIQEFGQEDVAVVWLHRNPLEVVRSYLRKEPTRYDGWFLNPGWEKNIIHESFGFSFAENILWEWLEVKARWKSMAKCLRISMEFETGMRWPLYWKDVVFYCLGLDHKIFNELPGSAEKNENREPPMTWEQVLAAWNEPGQSERPGGAAFSAEVLLEGIEILLNSGDAGPGLFRVQPLSGPTPDLLQTYSGLGKDRT